MPGGMARMTGIAYGPPIAKPEPPKQTATDKASAARIAAKSKKVAGK